MFGMQQPPRNMALEKEIATYNARLAELIQHEGKYVLIHGEEVVDTYTSYEDAVKAGYNLFKLEPFLVKRIETVEQVQLISRFYDPCAATSC